MALTIAQKPLAEVVETLSSKTPIGSVLRSAEWENVPDQLREDSFFSATVESARALSEAQAGLRQILTLARNPNGAIAMDRSKWIEHMQKLSNELGLRNIDPSKRGGLEDFGSERRLQLIFEQQIGQAQSKAYYMSGQDPDILNEWPAQELVRLREPKGGEAAKRDWRSRWVEAAEAVGWVGVARGTALMIALKTSPIWVALSRFKRPWPPFDYGSGMGLEERDRDDAEDLGLVKPGEILTPSVERDNEDRRASVKGLAPDMREALKAAFGKQIIFDGDDVRWRGQKASKVSPAPSKTRAPAESPDADLTIVQEARTDGPGEPIPQEPLADSPQTTQLRITPNDRRPDRQELQSVAERSIAALQASGFIDDGKPGGAELAQTVRVNSAEIAAVAAGRKALFHEQIGDLAPIAVEALQGNLPEGLVVREREGHLYVYRPAGTENDALGSLRSDLSVASVPVSFDEIHRLSVEGENGELLGYGHARMFDPGTVTVFIDDEAGNYLGGFHALPQEAETLARQRAADFADSLNLNVQVRMIERRK